MRYLLLIVILAFLSFSTGIYAASEFVAFRSVYKDTRYYVRTSLGLEKFWVNLAAKVERPKDPAVPCPNPSESLVIVTGGQSNAANSITTNYSSQPTDRVYSWYLGNCYIARDPLPGATGRDGSLWTSIGVDLGRNLDTPIILINGAVSTTQYADWLDERSGYLRALLTNVKQAQEFGFEPRLVLWHQGETDAGTNFDPDKLKQEIANLADELLQAMPESSLYLFRTSKCSGDGREDGVPAIRDLQTLVAEENTRIISGMNTDELGDDYRWDRCHFNSMGRSAIVKQVVPELVSYLRSDSVSFSEN